MPARRPNDSTSTHTRTSRREESAALVPPDLQPTVLLPFCVVVVVVVKLFFEIARACPRRKLLHCALVSGLIVLFVLYVSLVKFKNAKREKEVKFKNAKREKEVGEIREKVIDKLSLSDEPISNVAVRDELARELYPYSRKDRGYLIDTLWPVVFKDMDDDSSIDKSFLAHGTHGVYQVHWKMLLKVDKKARRSRQQQKNTN